MIFTRACSRRRQTFALAAAMASLLLAVGFGGRRPGDAAPLLVNTSPSLPRGLYVRDAAIPRIGAVVAIRAPAHARPYLAGLGAPANPLLLKRVAATGGERVCSSGGRISTPREAVEVRVWDRQGARLPRWTGCGALNDGQLFLLGDSRTSFDSRYFGPVGSGDIVGVYRRVFP